MNIGIGKFIRDGLTLASIESAFRRLAATISAGWLIQHKEDGTHTDVTMDTIVIADPETGDEGNWTGSLIPTTATQDVGGFVEATSGIVFDRPIRDIRLSGDITWTAFSTSATSISGGVVLTSNSYTNAASAFTFTMTLGVNTHTFTIGRGLNGLTTDRAISCVGLTSTSQVRGTYMAVDDGMTAPGGTSGQAKIYVDTADGDLKVVFGDGTVKTIVTDT